ncbi:MAG: hypothetical protein FWG99_00685 [Treponema sp.]|nr:hypothetical protein [Treponema sp.]
MKKCKYLFLVTVLTVFVLFSLAACNDGSKNSDVYSVGNTIGSLTINDIPAEFNGKWAMASASDDNTGKFYTAAYFIITL